MISRNPSDKEEKFIHVVHRWKQEGKVENLVALHQRIADRDGKFYIVHCIGFIMDKTPNQVEALLQGRFYE